MLAVVNFTLKFIYFQNCMEIDEDGHVLTVHAPKESNRYKASARGIGEATHKYGFTQVFKPEIR